MKLPPFIKAWIPAAALVCVFFILPFIAPHDPNDVSLENTLAPPSALYLLGTDELGRCTFSRIIFGGRVTLGAALTVEASLFFTGILLGSLGGFFGGIFDAALVVVTDVLLAFPSLILAVVIAGGLGPGLQNLILAMALVYWVEHARIARSIALIVRKKEFVTAAEAIGGSRIGILFRHIMPQSLPVMLSHSVLDMARVIIGISSLSFLGLAVRPPDPEWGALLAQQCGFLSSNPAAAAATMLCIVVSAAVFQIAGENGGAALNPRQRALPKHL